MIYTDWLTVHLYGQVDVRSAVGCQAEVLNDSFTFRVVFMEYNQYPANEERVLRLSLYHYDTQTAKPQSRVKSCKKKSKSNLGIELFTKFSRDFQSKQSEETHSGLSGVPIYTAFCC